MTTARQLIIRDFELENTSVPEDQEALLDWLSDYVAELIERRLEYLLSWLYRMDISEAAVQAAFSPRHPEPANQTIARLILLRQEERARTKRDYPQQVDQEIDEELKW